MQLAGYSEHSRCPKCGNTNENSTMFCPCKLHTLEHMIRTCFRCGWQWSEAPHATTKTIMTKLGSTRMSEVTIPPDDDDDPNTRRDN